MIFMFEYTIELRRSLPFIGCKSGPSEWLEDLSRATGPLKFIQSSEDFSHLFENSDMYELVHPVQSFISDRFFEDIYKKEEYGIPEKLLFREQNGDVRTDEASDVRAIDTLLTRESCQADLERSVPYNSDRKKYSGSGLKDELPQAESDVRLKINFSEVEKEFPIDLRARKDLLQNIINRYGEEIEDNQLGQGLNSLKQALESPKIISVEKLERVEKTTAHYQKAEDKNSLQTRSSLQTENDSSGIIKEYPFGKNFKYTRSERISELFSRYIEGISTSKRLIKGKSENNGGQNTDLFTDYTEYNTKDLKSKSNYVLSEILNEQLERAPASKSGVPVNQRMPDVSSLKNINLLIERAYSKNRIQTGMKEDNRELVLKLMENISQAINQNNRDIAPSKQNIFNIHVSGHGPTSENDLKNLSDRLVLILKDQARRHGIDLS